MDANLIGWLAAAALAVIVPIGFTLAGIVAGWGWPGSKRSRSAALNADAADNRSTQIWEN
jgi:hypothetical protein